MKGYFTYLLRSLFALSLLIVSDLFFQPLQAQTFADGPIEVRARLREVRVTSGADSDVNIQLGPFTPGTIEEDEYSFKVWARGQANLGSQTPAGWVGGFCDTDEFNPSATIQSVDFNRTFATINWPTATVPRFLDIRLEAWEDDKPADFDLYPSSLGIVTNDCESSDGFSRCTFEGNSCCINSIFGCVVSESDDLHCNATNGFRNGLDYRQGNPCEWYDHGFITGNCPSNNIYRPRIQTFWRYSLGDNCGAGNAIDLGNFGPGSASIGHFNSNVCYNNSYIGSPGNDVHYQITITQPVGIRVSTCGSATFDNDLYLLNSGCGQLAFNSGGCGGSGLSSEFAYAICQPGVYYVVVDGRTITQEGTFTLTISEDPTLIVQADAGSNTSICVGTSTLIGGTPAAQNGQAPYSYAWSPTNNMTNPNIANPAVFPPSTQYYYLTVTDANGCISVDSILVTVNPGPAINLGVNRTVCPGTPVNFNAGSGFLNYFWSNGSNDSTITVIQPDTYRVAVIDINGCLGTDTVVVANHPNPIPNLGPDQDFCSGASTTLDAGFGYSAYTWSTGNTGRFQNVTAGGTYRVTVSDINGCNGIDSVSVTVNTLPTVTLGADTFICPGDLAVLNPGTGFLAYGWSNGGTNQIQNVPPGSYSVTVTDTNGCQDADSINVIGRTAPIVNLGLPVFICAGDSFQLDAGAGWTGYTWNTGETTRTIFARFPGLYTVTVTDINGCEGTDSTQISWNFPPTVDLGRDTTLCQGGSVTLDAGNPGANYLWSTGATSQTIPVLTPGTYIVTVTTGNGCSDVDSVNVGVSPNPVPLLNNQNVCAGTQVTLNPGAGFSSYSWSNGANSQNISVTTPGTYSVTVTNASGCVGTASMTLSNFPAVTPNLGGNQSLCQGQSLTLTPGNTFVAYNWNTGETGTTINVTGGGLYSVTVTDAFGCTGADTVIITPLSRPTLNLGPDSVVVCSAPNFTLNATAGMSNYAWSNGATGASTTVTTTGVYSVTITDGNGCTNTDEIEVVIANHTVSLGPDQIICDSAEVVLDAGPGYATYTWAPPMSSNQYLTITSPGIYGVTVTDVYGCVATDDIQVTESGPQLSPFMGPDVVLCQGDSLTLDAGDEYEYYMWDNGSPDQYLRIGAAGVFSVTVTDPAGCRFFDTLRVTLETPPVLELGPSINICPDEVIPVDAGAGFLTYLWSTGATTQSIEVTAPGAYAVAATTANCRVSDELLVGDDCPGRLFVPNVFTPNRDGLNDEFAPVGVNVTDYLMKVFDRWGKQLFESNDLNSTWDGTFNGKDCPEGVYFFFIEYKVIDDETDKEEKGSVTLIR